MTADSQLMMELLALGAINPWPGNDSSPRVQMLLSQIGQALQVKGATRPRIVTGIERQLATTTFNRKMPCNATILKVIQKYPPTIGQGGIKMNPLTLVIYENYDTREIACLELPYYHCMHQHFGFKYKPTPNANRLVPMATMAKGTILADSPAVDDDGNYCFGVESEVALMSIPQVIEDGVVVSRSYVDRITTRGYETRVGSWGSKRYPLNLYGDPNIPGDYKAFPDIGDRIRPDGLLMALRTYDPMMSVVEMTDDALREPDYFTDELIYAVPNAKVVDVVVHHNTNESCPPTPVGMEVQCDKYYRAATEFYHKVWDEYRRLDRERGDDLEINPNFQTVAREAYRHRVDGTKRVTKTYRNAPIDDWRVEVTFEYDVVPNIGFKLTGCHGDKGVICDIWDDEDMPVDMEGNRADLIMDGESTIKRMNVGRTYRQYLNAASRTLTHRMRDAFGVDRHKPNPKQVRDVTRGGDLVPLWMDKLLQYYDIISPLMADNIKSRMEAGSWDTVEHVRSVLTDGIYLWLPTHNPRQPVDYIQEIQKTFPPVFGPVQYRGRSGRLVTTKSNVLIGSMYILLLEKTGSDWSGVSSAKLQHFGIPAKLTNADKYSSPGRTSPVRIVGEAEARLMAAVVGGDVVADILDQSNNPVVHKKIVSNIITAEHPSRIEEVVDREEIPRGNGRALVYMRHSLECQGIKFVQENDDV